MDIFIVDTIARDTGDKMEILSIGKSTDGQTVCVRCPFAPSFYVIVPEKNPTMQQKATMKRKCLEAFDPYDKGGVNVSLIEQTQFVGYRGGETDWFVEVTFDTLKKFRQSRYTAKDKNFITFEAGVDPMLKYFHRADIDPCGWTRFEGLVTVPTSDETRLSKSYVQEFKVKGPGSVTRSSLHAQPDLKIASFDFECYSSTGSVSRRGGSR